jgi:hypothetical protein
MDVKNVNQVFYPGRAIKNDNPPLLGSPGLNLDPTQHLLLTHLPKDYDCHWGPGMS